MAPPGLRLGQLEGASRTVAGFGQPAAHGLHLGQQVECTSPLGRPAGLDERVRPTAQCRLIARGQSEGSAVGLKRIVEPAQANQHSPPAGQRQCPVGGNVGGLGVGHQGLIQPAVQSGDVAEAESLLVAIVRGIGHGWPPAG